MTVAKIRFHASAFFWLAFLLRDRTYSWARTPRVTGRYARRNGARARCSHGVGVFARGAIRATEPFWFLVLPVIVTLSIVRSN